MSIGRNTAYNLAGFAVPTVLGILAVPAYLALIGPERFGVLALAWLILGYFGLFDLGLGRATAQAIAALRHAAPQARQQTLATSLLTNLVIGLAGALLLWPLATLVFDRFLELAPAMRSEALRAAPLLALSLPVATTGGVLSGALMGAEAFRDSNRISITSTALFQFLPLGFAWAWGPDLSLLLIAAIAARLAGVAMLWRACRRIFGPLGGSPGRSWNRAQARKLLGFGGWMTLAALIGPLMVFSDRFLIGATLGAVAVTIYTVPMDAMRRLTGAALALANALFPRLALADEGEARRLARDAVGAMYAVFTPLVAAALMAMDPAMRLWLGAEIGAQAAPLARILLVATWLNCFAQVPATRLQASGRPDLVSKLLLVQVPFYLAALWFALHHFGLAGAAWVYLLRVVADTALLFFFAGRRMAHASVIGFAALAMTALSILLAYIAPLGWAAAGAGGLAIAATTAAQASVIAPAPLRGALRGGLDRLRRRRTETQGP